MNEGCFRKKNGYTVVQNTISRDKRLSMKAKGLYLIIQSYITMPDKQWHKSDFMNMVSEGKAAFNSAWDELKENGYLKIYIVHAGKRGTYREYELLDDPVTGPSEIHVSGKSEESLENTGFVQLPDFQVPENQEVENQVLEKQEPDNRAAGNINNNNLKNNINNNNNKTDNNNLSSIQSLYRDDEEVMEELKEQIELDRLLDIHPANKKLIHYIYNLMGEILQSPEPYMMIQKKEVPMENIRKRYLAIRFEHLEYLLHQLPEDDSNIMQKRRYMITCLYNCVENAGAICKTRQIKTKSKYGNEIDFDELENNFFIS